MNEMRLPARTGINLYALLGLLILCFIWGYNWVVMKQALRYSQPFTFSALRCLLGALCLFLVLLILRRPMSPGSWLGAFVLGLLQIAGCSGLSVWALVSGNVGKTVVLSYTMPFWVLALAWPVLDERPHGPEWLAAALAFAGLFLILQPWRFHQQLFSALLATTSGICWALAAVWAKRWRKKERIDLLPLTAWQLLLGGIPLLLVGLWRENMAANWTPYFVGALTYNAVLVMALAWLLWLYALRELPVGLSSMGTLFVPLIGVLTAWVRLGEVPNVLEGGGMVLVLAGLGILVLEQKRRALSREKARMPRSEERG
jgi:drug/metabolite transporter (DMT)-like permease